MKNIFITTLIALLITPIISSAQMSSAADHEIIASGIYDQNVVKLRWSPSDRVTWRKLNDCGVTITRTTIKRQGQDLSYEDRMQSTVELISNLKPLSDPDFQTQVSSDEGTLVRKALYSDEEDEPMNATPNMLDAKNYMEHEEMKFIFSVVAVDQDYEVAKAAAWGWEDSTTSPNFTYAYIISPSTDDPSFEVANGMLMVSSSPGGSFPSITNLEATPAIESIELGWDNPSECKFTSFNILRSSDGSNFSQLNQQPFIYMANDKEMGRIAFVDESAESGKSYYYKVVGLTPFATESSPSEVVGATALYTRLDGIVIYYDEETITEEDITLRWTIDTEFETDIQGFNVYRSEKSLEGYEQMNSSLLAKSQREYIDDTPLEDGYYYVEAIDLNENAYITRKFMCMLPDTDPPAQPSGVVGKYISSSELMISWDANEEEDLDGYKIYASNQLDGTYIQLHDRILQANNYTHLTDPSVIGDSLYIKVRAQDKRENYSEHSTPIAIKRYDDVPPSAPLLSRVFPSVDGIEISWEYSASEDVTQHYIERKAMGTPSWEQILTISKENENNYCLGNGDPVVCFVDSVGLLNTEYQYRMVAQGEDYQLGGSEPMNVTPSVAALQGDVSNVEIEQVEEELPPNNLVEDQINNLIERGNNQFRSSSSGAVVKNINLDWVYNLGPNVLDFQIFRSTTAGSPVLYRTVSIGSAMGFAADQEVSVQIDQGPTSFEWSDNDLTEGMRYTYQIMARHKDGSTSNRSMVLSKKID